MARSSSPKSHMPSCPLAEPVPKFLAQKRIDALGGIGAVAERLGMPERVARALLLSERPLPTWIRDALFVEPRRSEADAQRTPDLESELEDHFPTTRWDDVAPSPLHRVNSPNRS